MAVIFKDGNGKKVTIKGSGGSGIKRAVEALDNKKDKEKEYWQMKECAISEGLAGVTNDLNKSIPDFIAKSKQAITASAKALSADADSQGASVLAALQQISATLSLLNGVLGDMQIYFNISKPDNMYFMNDDKTLGEAESSEDVSSDDFNNSDFDSADNNK